MSKRTLERGFMYVGNLRGSGKDAAICCVPPHTHRVNSDDTLCSDLLTGLSRKRTPADYMHYSFLRAENPQIRLDFASNPCTSSDFSLER